MQVTPQEGIRHRQHTWTTRGATGSNRADYVISFFACSTVYARGRGGRKLSEITVFWGGAKGVPFSPGARRGGGDRANRPRATSCVCIFSQVFRCVLELRRKTLCCSVPPTGVEILLSFALCVRLFPLVLFALGKMLFEVSEDICVVLCCVVLCCVVLCCVVLCCVVLCCVVWYSCYFPSWCYGAGGGGKKGEGSTCMSSRLTVLRGAASGPVLSLFSSSTDTVFFD